MARLIVEKDKIVKNAKIIFNEVKTANVIGVVKGNGYGLSLVPYARTLMEAGVNALAVTSLRDCQVLRQNGIAVPVLLMLPLFTEEDVRIAIENDVTMTVASNENALLMASVARSMGKRAKAHVKIDSGFGRYGFGLDEIDKVAAVYTMMDDIEVGGIYSHLASSFARDGRGSMDQFLKFSSLLDALKKRGINVGTRHIANSCAALRFPELRLDAVRMGSAFLGRLPIKNRWGLERIGYMEGSIVSLRWLKEGTTVGYGGACKIKKPTKAAVVDVGYTDGFCTEKSRDSFRFGDVLRYAFADLKKLGRRVYVSVRGKKAPVMGHVAMNNMVIDVTKIDCALGDKVKLDINPLLVGERVERAYI